MISVPVLIFLALFILAVIAVCWACRWSDPNYIRVVAPESGRTYLVLASDAAHVRRELNEHLGARLLDRGPD